MGVILALNCGSSSVKYQVYDWDKQSVICNGLVDRIGFVDSNIRHRYSENKVDTKTVCLDHKSAIRIILHFLMQEAKLVSSYDDFEGVGHRVVHGGDKFSRSVLITHDVLEAIKANVELAPLHNPPNIVGIESAMEVMPKTPQIAVFDTAFHQTIPDYAFYYGLDYDLSRKYAIRRYGFHGSSHRYISEKAVEFFGRKDIKIISIHVGNGSSLTAIQDGNSVDTSMVMTPLQGVIMGTRCGDLDPALAMILMDKLGENTQQLNDRLNKKSGMLGISGVTSDQRDIYAAATAGAYRSQLALKMQAYSIKKYIGSYLAAMNGADALVFTAGIGENSSAFREAVCSDMENLGIVIDKEKNASHGEVDISAKKSKIKVLVIPTNEEYVLARDVMEIVRGKVDQCVSSAK